MSFGTLLRVVELYKTKFERNRGLVRLSKQNDAGAPWLGLLCINTAQVLVLSQPTAAARCSGDTDVHPNGSSLPASSADDSDSECSLS